MMMLLPWFQQTFNSLFVLFCFHNLESQIRFLVYLFHKYHVDGCGWWFDPHPSLYILWQNTETQVAPGGEASALNGTCCHQCVDKKLL